MIITAEKIISCFIDEAGDFGEYDYHSPYYIVAVVVHDQSDSIQSDIDGLEEYMKSIGYPKHAIHAGPLIRRESVYEDVLMEDRRKMFNLLFRFTRKIPIQFFTAKIIPLKVVHFDVDMIIDSNFLSISREQLGG